MMTVIENGLGPRPETIRHSSIPISCIVVNVWKLPFDRALILGCHFAQNNLMKQYPALFIRDASAAAANR